MAVYLSKMAATMVGSTSTPYIDLVLLILHFFGPLGLQGSTLSWKLSVAQPRARRREGCRIFQYFSLNRLNQTESAVFNFGCCISKGLAFQIIQGGKEHHSAIFSLRILCEFRLYYVFIDFKTGLTGYGMKLYVQL